MDPGNWGTDIEAGSKFGYRLMWILLLSNAMAVLLQTLAARLGIVTGRDLAQACREQYPRWMGGVLWVLCEIAIAACDLAEVIGTVIALKLLFGLSYLWGLAIAATDTFLLLALQRRGIRILELVTLALVATIAGTFVFEISRASPEWTEVLRGFIPSFDTTNAARLKESIYIAIGMLGATVMPHNLYLHSALVQTRAFPHTLPGKRLACKYNLLDSLLALNGAFFVNAAILVMSVTTFYVFNKPVEKLQDAHQLLHEIWGAAASGLFAVALLASGQSSTLTGTLAGQVVMEGFVRLRIRPWARRMLTRGLAIVPALLAIGFAEQMGWGAESVDERLLELLVLSQVVLSFQLPFAIVPLIHFTSDHSRMGPFASRTWLKVGAWLCAALVIGLNMLLIVLQMERWAESAVQSGGTAVWIRTSVLGVSIALGAFLALVAIYPLTAKPLAPAALTQAPTLSGVRFRRIGLAVELEDADDAILDQGAALARTHEADLVLIHIVEGLGADIHGPASDDQESRRDRHRIGQLAEHLEAHGLRADSVLGYGTPFAELARIVEEEGIELLVIGSHGHRFLADLTLGQTVSPLLHRLAIPVLVVPSREPRSG
jgi:manganese transport protein